MYNQPKPVDQKAKEQGLKHTLGGARSKTRVQVVGHLVEESGRYLLPSVIDKEDLDGPGPLREAFDLGRLITKA